MSRPRGFVVVTGSELVRGDRTDLNGPFLAQELLRLGVEPARIAIVGDDPAELEAALREGLEADICLVTGGLGPTHDDRTVEVVANTTGRGLVVEPGLESEIEGVSRRIAERLRRPYADFTAGVRKQATVPQGALVLGLAGTAPGLVVEGGNGPVVVLPGPPPELKRLWPRALESEPVRRVLERAQPPQRRVLRFYGASESEIARALQEAGGEGDGVTATICAREFEIHVDLIVEAGAEERAEELAASLRERAGKHLFTEDERPVEALVLEACRARGLTLVTAESCTGGLVAARLTSVPGSSDVFLGAVVAYADAVKAAELGVPDFGPGALRSGVSRSRGGDGGRRPRAAPRRRGSRCDRRGRPRWRHRAETGRAGLSARRGPGREPRRESSTSRASARRSGRGRRSPRSTWCARFWHKVVTKTHEPSC